MPNKRRVCALKRILLGVICVAVIFFTANAIVNRIAFDPYKNREDTYAFNVLTQLLSPSVSYSWLDQNNPQQFTFFGTYTQQVILDQFPERSTGEETVGTLEYRGGKISFTDYNDRLGFEGLTCHQGIFMEKTSQEGFDEKISAENQYEAWFRFAEPMNGEEFVESYGYLLDNSQSRPKSSGLLWMAVKTSSNEADLCLGSIGNLSVHYLNNPVFGLSDYFDMDIYEREDIFHQALRYLIDHPKETQMFLNSGLYADGENLDFEQRLSYIENHGIQYLGMVGYLRGDVLLSLKSDANLSLIKWVRR